ncbi:unnamed protein product [Cylindrotheca closterium]|uniref:Procollagen-proline 4-dioxygenase n=1 Tax=Cylindrotheca closterium TaxID=2856 RepID=A0AAD2FYC0_9STRA|nr:unnamed protein product [Cylindrotheca closterium]
MKREYLSIIASLSIIILLNHSAIASEVHRPKHQYDEHEEEYYEEYEEEVEIEYDEEIFEFEFDEDDEEDYFEDYQPQDKECYDENEHCDLWASLGECHANPSYMRRVCRRSCDTCAHVATGSRFRRGLDVMSYEELIELDTAEDSYDIAPCADKTRNCPRLAKEGECESDPEYMEEACPESCNICDKSVYILRGADLGVPQSLVVDSGTKRQDITWMLGKARNYIAHYAEYEEDPEVLSWCQNDHRLCAFWAVHGECEANEPYMKEHCAPICNSCTWNDYHLRCPIDPDAKPAWKSGDLNRMFQAIASNAGNEFTVEVLSSPETDGPWVVTVDNLLSEDEAKRLVELGQLSGYERSQQVGDVDSDGTMESEISNDRTSTNAWCMEEADCSQDEVTLRVLERIENLTGVPSENGEYMQLLKYEPGQYYKPHHDYIYEHEEKQIGVRILTVFLYLNDVEEGGSTYFDKLDLKVEPKLGKALIWPSTLDESPNEIELRTQHEAQPVTKGVKYAANVWYHQYSYKAADRTGCVD